MATFIGYIVIFFFGFIAAVVAFTLLSLKIEKLDNGKKKISLFWGLIKIDEEAETVNVFGKFIKVDGKSNSVSVDGIADISGDNQTINIGEGSIYIDGKSGQAKIRQDVFIKEEDGVIYIENNFESKVLKSILSFTEAVGKDLKFKGHVHGEEGEYILIEIDGKKPTFEFDINFSK